jgi:hypothetical protein
MLAHGKLIIASFALTAASFGCGSSLETNTGGSAATTTATGAATCSACVGPLAEGGGACASALAACGADSSCSTWLTCTGACLKAGSGQDCYVACGEASASATSLWQSVKTCVCDHCAAECAAPSSDYCPAP